MTNIREITFGPHFREAMKQAHTRKRIVMESEIPVLIPFDDKGLPLAVGRLTKDPNTQKWQWRVDNNLLLDAIDFGDEVEQSEFEQYVNEFIEARKNLHPTPQGPSL